MNTSVKRNDGIELFRIVSMLMVLILHITCHGGIMAEASTLPTHSYLLTSFISYFVYCCVDCFALISGFVGYRDEERPYKYHKYASFWLQAVLYGFLGRVIVMLSHANQGNLVWREVFFPLITDNWWYFSAYTALFFLIPFINKMIRGLSSHQFHFLIVILVLFFSFIETFSNRDLFRLDEGFSFLWLSILYVIGAWVKRERIHEKLQARKLIVMFVAFTEIIITWIIWEKLRLPILRTYTSPTILFFAVSLLIFFSTLKVNLYFFRKLIRIFSPCAFGVYLMHTENHFWISVLKNSFRFVVHAPTIAIPFIIVGFAIAFYLSVSVIELLRTKLFSLLHVDQIAKKGELMIRKQLSKFSLLLE